jgi:ribosomal protein S18 acetylase RimI-like enzyme
MTVRTYRETDEAAVVALWKASDLVVPWNDPYKDIRKKVAFQPDLFFVAEADREVVGTIMAGYEGHRGWINYLAVAPERRRRGIGRSLVHHAIVELERLGCQKVNLQVRASNSGVIEFYRALGFERDNVISLGLRIEAVGSK